MELMSHGKRPIFYQLTSLKDFYMNHNLLVYDKVLRGNQTSLNILTVVAILLLLVGIFNYVNLYTVVMLRRAREFGVKKVFGANGKQYFATIFRELLSGSSGFTLYLDTCRNNPQYCYFMVRNSCDVRFVF